uniref:non-specific serine/threonine protein kinase n=1 Tax=Panagrolaimus davidi TaxID=227884 RepID=A0A914QUA5_9BILA
MLEQFRLISVLGRGHFGKVILSQFKPTSKYFALKILKKGDILARDETESLMSEKLFIIIIIWDTVAHGIMYMLGVTYIYMLTNVSSIHLLILIIFNDLKLDNLLMDRDGYVKLGDFGLCKERINPTDRTSTFCGTPEFEAPEVLLETSYTSAEDFWGLGVLNYEMFSGEPPFSGEEEEEFFNAIVNSDGYSENNANEINRQKFFGRYAENVSIFDEEFTQKVQKFSAAKNPRVTTEKDNELFRNYDFSSFG